MTWYSTLSIWSSLVSLSEHPHLGLGRRWRILHLCRGYSQHILSTGSVDQVDLGVMATKGYSTLLRTPEVKPHHQMPFNTILRTSLKILSKLYQHFVSFLSLYYRNYDEALQTLCILLLWGGKLIFFFHLIMKFCYQKQLRKLKKNWFYFHLSICE